MQQLLDQGWQYHDTESERLAGELEAAAGSAATADLLAPFLHLSNHTIGEHLGDWRRAFELGRRLLEGRAPDAESARAWGRLFVAATLAGQPLDAAAAELSYLRAAGGDFGAVFLDMRFMLAGALISAKRVGEAARLCRGALDVAGQVQPSPFLVRTIAAASNNLGWELYEKSSRSPEEDALMRLAAATALDFWRQGGDWINEERALYLKALVANATGEPEAGLAEADRALAVIDAHGQRPLDAALLQLARAAALTALGDQDGRARAIEAADAAAAKLTLPALQAQFAGERSKITSLQGGGIR